MSTFKSKIVFGSHTATSIWVSIVKPLTFMTNFSERQMTMTTISSRHAATTPFACTMMPKDKLLKPRMKVPFKPDYFSIWLIRRTTKNHSCNTIKNWAKVQKTNSHWLQFTTWEDITKKPLKFIKSFCSKAESMKPSTFILLCVTTKWSTMMWVSKFCQVTKHLTLKAFSLPILRPATIIKFIQAKMQRKFWDQFNKSSKEVICSRKATFWDTTWLFSEVDRTLCKFYLP